MTKQEYNEILEGVLTRAGINKEIDEIKRTLENYTYEELREKLRINRLNYQLNDDEIYKRKAVAIDTEMTKRLLNL